jgi:dolichol-phosphate mannosyltransferase
MRKQFGVSSVLVMIPAPRDIGSLVDVARRVLAATDEVDILVVERTPSASGDRAGNADAAGLGDRAGLADALEFAAGRITVLPRPSQPSANNGYRAALGWGLRAGYEFMVEMRGDGSHRPEDLPALLEAARGADVVVGSPLVGSPLVGRRGSAPQRPRRRRLIARAICRYARVALSLPLHDRTSDYRIYRTTALHAIDYRSIDDRGHTFRIEMLRRARAAGQRIVEVPVDLDERATGSSTGTVADAAVTVLRVTAWGLQDMPRRALGAVRQRRAASLLTDGTASDLPQVHGGLAPAYAFDGRD